MNADWLGRWALVAALALCAAGVSPRLWAAEAPKPLNKAKLAEFGERGLAVRDLQIEALQARVAILEAKLAGVEGLLTEDADRRLDAALEKFGVWEQSLAGGSGCSLSSRATWVDAATGEPCQAAGAGE